MIARQQHQRSAVSVSKWKTVRDYAQIAFLTLLVALLTKLFVVDAIYVPSPSMEGTLMTGDYVLVNKLLYGAKSPNNLPLLQSGIPFFHLPGLRSVERGDVVVFEFPSGSVQQSESERTYFVKRCVAIAGDQLSLQGGNVFVNGVRLYLPLLTGKYGSVKDFGPVTVPKKGDIVALSRGNFSLWEELIQGEGHTVNIRNSSEIIIDGKPASSYSVEKDYLFVLGDNLNHSYDSREWGFLSADNVVGSAMIVYWSVDPATAMNNAGDFLSSVRWGRMGTFIK